MNGRRALILSLIVLFFAHLAFYYPQLPEKMATHFNHLGEPDGWMSKNGFFAFAAGMMIFLVGTFFSISYLVRKIPVTLINLPNRDYWLAPERREEAFRRLKAEMEIFVVPLLLLLLGVNQMTFHANLHGGNLSSVSWFLIGAFFVYTIYWSIGFYRKFRIYEN